MKIFFQKYKIHLLVTAALLSVALLFYLLRPQMNNFWDDSKISREKMLYASVEVNSIDYFIQRGNPTGFQLELLEKFAQSQGLKLRIYASNQINEHLDWLKTQQTDICAVNLAISEDRERYLLFSDAIC